MKKVSFTLVEMVIAMAILILVGSLIGTASLIFYNAYNRTIRQTERLKEFVAIDQVMDQSLRNAIPFQWLNKEENVKKYVFLGKVDEVIFTSLRRSHGKDQGALIFVRIRLDGTDLIAEYSSYPILPWEIEKEESNTKITREVLTGNVQAVNFLYAERDSEGEIEFVDEWIEEDHDGIPLAIQMEVEWIGGKKERWLRRTAGSAANATYGNRQNQNGLNQSSGSRRTGSSRGTRQ